MKKMKFSGNNKSSKGFYTALGISAVMIGSACLFAYNQGEKLSKEDLAAEASIASETAVDKLKDDIPKPSNYTVVKPTQPSLTPTQPTPTQPSTQTPTVSSAAVITVVPSTEAPKAPSEPAVAEASPKFSAPLSDMSSIVNLFSGTELVKNATTGSWQTHNGTDIAAVIGSEVFAAADGEVSSVNNDPLWGITVTIDHRNGYITKYCGLAHDLSVSEGDTVTAGSPIGAVGDTCDIESALDPHLHFEVLHNGKFIDPESIIG